MLLRICSLPQIVTRQVDGDVVVKLVRWERLTMAWLLKRGVAVPILLPISPYL